MEDFLKKELIYYFKSFVSNNRLKLFKKILSQRTRNLTIVLEDIFQHRNLSAVLRTADSFGIQDIHIIENKNKFEIDKTVSLGSEKWMSIYKYNQLKQNTSKCLNKLKKDGYTIIASSTDESAESLNEIELKSKKIAVIFGTELKGLSKEAIKLSDRKVKIKMDGFSESLNISVAAAIFCYSIKNQIIKNNENWRLTNREKEDVLLNWLRNSIKSSNIIEEKFIKKNK